MMNKTKVILKDIILFTVLIINLLKPNVYIGYLVSLISILTIILHSLMIFGYIGRKNTDKKTKKRLREYFKNQGKIFKLYQHITNIGLTVLFALNGLIATAVIYTLSILVLGAFKKELNENKKRN